MTTPITQLFAWVADDPTGTHGILAVMTPGGLPMQAVSSRIDLMAMAKRDVVRIAKEIGCPIQLKRFALVEQIDEVKP